MPIRIKLEATDQEHAMLLIQADDNEWRCELRVGYSLHITPSAERRLRKVETLIERMESVSTELLDDAIELGVDLGMSEEVIEQAVRQAKLDGQDDQS